MKVRSRLFCLLLCGAAVSIACAHARTPPAAEPGAGRLVVLVVIDQLRYAELLLLAPELGDAGFAGLGAPLPARYETLNTETAAGHATLSTGAWPEVHGIVGNSLLEDGAPRAAVDDARCPEWGKRAGGRSAAALLVPTVGDELKLASLGRARVVAIAGKDRAALLLAGQSADLALYWDPDQGQLTSTSCYADAPPPWVQLERQALPLSKWLHWEWSPSRPLQRLSRYGVAEAPGAVPSNGIGPRFPHAVGQGDLSPRYYKALRASPAGTEILLGAARAAAEGLSLGARGEADLLLISLSAADYSGHAFGAQSVEKIDNLLVMHDELSRFFAHLRGRLGERVSFVLSSDHGAPPLGQHARALRLPGGALAAPALRARLEQALSTKFAHPPPDGFVTFLDDPWLGLRRVPGVALESLAAAAAEALEREPGIARALTAAQVLAEPAVSPFRHSFAPGRSGDVLFEARPGWNFPPEGDAMEHRAHWNEAALVPLLISAPGFELRPALRGATLRTTQVAPTLARLLGIAPPAAALDEAAVVAIDR